MQGTVEIVSIGIDQARIFSRLTPHFPLKRGSFVSIRASADPLGLPPFVQLVGAVALLSPLSVAAGAFLKRLAENAADALWKAIERSFSRRDSREAALAELVASLVEARSNMGDAGRVIFGLSFPQSQWGTVVVVRENDARKIASAVAGFIARVDDIFRLIEAEIAAGTKPWGYVEVEIGDGRATAIRWIDQNFAQQVRALPQLEPQQ